MKKKLLNYGKQKKREYQNILLSLINNQNLVSLKNPRSIEFNTFFPSFFLLCFLLPMSSVDVYTYLFCGRFSNKYPKKKSKSQAINFDAVCSHFIKLLFQSLLGSKTTQKFLFFGGG